MTTPFAEQINEAAEYIRNRIDQKASTLIILGTGLSEIRDKLSATASIPYEDIPHFPRSTVSSHRGELIFGQLAGIPVYVMAGRFHYYEGYSAREVALPIWVMANLGISQVFITNAAGGTNPAYQKGDIVFIRDHINLHPDNPLRGLPNDFPGTRFPDMSEAYDRKVLNVAKMACAKHGLPYKTGIYVGLQGPSLETPAEYNLIHIIGGDMVGMSTVHEVIAARQAGITVCAISVITNVSYPLSRIEPTTVESVIALARQVSPKLDKVLHTIVEKLADT